MKSNFNEIFNEMLPDLLGAKEVNIDNVLDDFMTLIRFKRYVSRRELVRRVLRSELTTALNKNQIYSYEKGKFVFIENADEEQLKTFIKKADRDIRAAESRKAKAETFKSQISMAWDENGDFIGFIIPEAQTI